jgi:nitric oxide reductase large subunit
VSPAADNNLGVNTNNLRAAQMQTDLPIIIGATVGGACVVAGVITTVVLVQRYRQGQMMTALHQPLADV